MIIPEINDVPIVMSCDCPEGSPARWTPKLGWHHPSEAGHHWDDVHGWVKNFTCK